MSLINKEKSNFNKKYILKWMILIVIIAMISGIGYIKNNNSNNNKVADNAENTSKFDLDATNNINIDQLKTYGLPMIIDFGSDSCIPCKEMAPTLKALNQELKGKAIVKFVDVWKNQDVAQNLPIKVIPTQFFFDKNGKPYVPKFNEDGFTMYKDKTTGEHLFTTHEGGMDKASIQKVLKEMGLE
jgi:thioredoxin 1